MTLPVPIMRHTKSLGFKGLTAPAIDGTLCSVEPVLKYELTNRIEQTR